VLSVDLAQRLRAAGLRWAPSRGDRFVLPQRGMDDEVFVLSDMTVEVHEFPGGKVIGFNGVTEWALDSVDVHEALWLPVEHQLRGLLGGLFQRLEVDGGHFTVTVRRPDGEHTYAADDAEQAYGAALLDLLRELSDATPVGDPARTSVYGA
jgi:hypothetical protein